MVLERGVFWWLPATFIVEVAAWEIGVRMDMAFADPTWLAFGDAIDIERVTWILGGVVAALCAVFLLATRRRHTTHISLVQLVGVLALAAYWIGASTLASGVVVALATVATWILGHRPVR
jgi:hypothetical protein